jgi:hypothetical protein
VRFHYGADSDKVTGAIIADGLRPWGFVRPQPCAGLKFDLLRDGERIINLDPEISDSTFQLCVPKQ